MRHEYEQRLHDRATRGDRLSPAEHAQLDAWYAAQDRAECDMIGVTVTTDTLPALQTKIDSALAQIVDLTKQIRDTTTENKALRHEITTLRRQLAHRTSPQPA